MTQENKEFLLKDLCSRLPYKVKCKIDLQSFIDMCDEYKERFEKAKIVIPDLFNRIDKPYCLWLISGDRVNFLGFDGIDDYNIPIELVKPYLFPMSNKTEEQNKEWRSLMNRDVYGILYPTIESYDYLNKHHFDYIGLIENGLAIDATNLNIY